MSDLARYLAGDNYLTRSASGIKRGMSALADSLAARSNEGIENMDAALSGVRVMPGAILTDAGYVMPDASGQPDFTQVGLEREPDTMRLLELFGSAMTPVKGASVAAKSGAGGKVAADVARALPMDEAMRIAQANAAKPINQGGLGLGPNNTAAERASAMGYIIEGYHGTGDDFKAFDTLASKGKSAGTGAFISSSPDVASTYATGINPQVMPLLIREDAPVEFAAKGENWNRLGKSTRVKSPEISAPMITQDDLNLLAELYGDPSGSQSAVKVKARNTSLGRMFPDELKYSDDYSSTDDLSRWARKSGYEGAVFRDVVDRGPAGMYHTPSASLPADLHVVFDPSRIRSRFAAFDPARADEADLLASRANLGPIVNALLQGYDRR